ncbi:hypothetical protein [Pseudonocardia kunmingensis]|uniref:DUF5666 domain-containing protein n=1 Tax=Pseudonocardia kunmingensis TaxID=630975 RepID=A0A543CYR4_9PSEU|nr:hypothetical protein [Pseudonocardia kunmingensis]TQM02237.1 hypothetical protein FB558_8103 [Pseudonocardia kunmingensis]
MSSTEPPTTQTTQRPPWRSRLRSRGVVITAVVAALVVIAGVTAAVLWPDDDRGRFGPGFDRAGWSSPVERGPWGEGGPGRWGDDDRGDRDDDRDDDDAPGPRGFGFGDDPVVIGTVASVADGSLVVNVDGAGPRTLRTDRDTEVGGPSNSALGDLQTGERVVVEIEGTGDAATADSVWTPQASVTGTVTALTGTTATVTSVEGLTVTADVAALSQKPAVGDVVVLTGTADASSIRADGIRILPRAS